MLWHKAQGAGGTGGGPIEYIGSTTKTASNENAWNTVNEAPDILSIASTGDFVIGAISWSENNFGEPINFLGMTLSNALFYNQGFFDVGLQIVYGTVQSGDTNPYVTSSNFDGVSSVWAVFRNVSSFVNGAYDEGEEGVNPPPLTATAGLWLTSAHIGDDRNGEYDAPNGYTFITERVYSSEFSSTTALGYKIADLTSDNPGDWLIPFTQNDKFSTTLAFSA